jgi:hypothetical protein
MLMQHHIGLWIDHRRAVIVQASYSEEEVKVIVSGADKQPSRVDGEKSKEDFEAQQVLADDVRERKFTHELKGYYDEVIACVHGAKSLLIMGPGEAKVELKKRLAQERPSDRTLHVEAADKMTDREIVAKVRGYFKTATPVIVKGA